MPSSKNIQELDSLKSKLAGAKAIFFADYQGLSVSQMGDLRSKIREATGELSVAKNTLIKIALKENGLPRDLEEVLRGPTAILVAKEDEISPLKAMVEYAKNAELPKIKAGIFEDRILTEKEVNELAKLPGKKELQVKIVGILKGPLYGFVNVLAGTPRKLVYVLEALRKQKETNSESKGGDS